MLNFKSNERITQKGTTDVQVAASAQIVHTRRAIQQTTVVSLIKIPNKLSIRCTFIQCNDQYHLQCQHHNTATF
jgi:hypothetical protein